MTDGYALRSRWHLLHDRSEIWELLGELLATEDPLPWWPGVTVLHYADGRLILRVGSRLGYALTVHLSDLVTEPPSRLSFRTDGDLVGTGVVELAASDRTATVDIGLHVEPRLVWMRRTQWLLRPVFVLNHRHVMGRGRRHLDRWMRRRTDTA